MAKVFPFSVLATADLVIDSSYEGGTKGNTADDVLGKLIPGAGNQGGFRAVGSWDAPRLVILLSEVIGVLTLDQYQQLKVEVEQARLNAEHARDALLAHRDEHGC